MANTFELIASYTATGSVSSIDFSSIPSTYTDLCVVHSIRTNRAVYVDGIGLRFNNDSGANYSDKYLFGYSGGAVSGSNSGAVWLSGGKATGTTATANTFGNSSIYIPNYTGSAYKSISVDAVTENNAADSWTEFDAGLWPSSAAINRITLLPQIGTSILQYSTAYLYGVKNA